jgi:hypothetical protein
MTQTKHRTIAELPTGYRDVVMCPEQIVFVDRDEDGLLTLHYSGTRLPAPLVVRVPPEQLELDFDGPTPPGTFGPDDYGPDSFPGSDY